MFTYTATRGRFYTLPQRSYMVNGGRPIYCLRNLVRELRNLYVPRRLVRVALSQIKDGSHTCVYGGKWGKDLVEVVRI
jgi:hypothetical protein